MLFFEVSEFVFFLLIVFLIIGTLSLPWINYINYNRLNKEIADLKNKIKQMGSGVNSLKTDQSTPNKHSIPIPEPHQTNSIQTAHSDSTYSSQTQKKQTINFEHHLGKHLFVWLGGISLIFAGFYLIKFSIENDLLNPTVRVYLGGLLGLSLMGIAHWIKTKSQMESSSRVATSMMGAGIAILYAVLFAASNLYNLISLAVGLSSMAVVTGIAVVLSLRYGLPLACLSLIGGFLTPSLFNTDHLSMPAMLSYLYILFCVLMLVIRRNRWWILSLPLLIITLFWAIFWTLKAIDTGDTLWLSIFLIAISSTAALSSWGKDNNANKLEFKLTTTVNYLGFLVAAILMGFISSNSGYSVSEWVLYGFLSLASIGIAFNNEKKCGFAPWLSMLVNASMLYSWTFHDPIPFILAITLFSCAYTLIAYGLIWASSSPLHWAGLASTSSLIYYLVGYYKLQPYSLMIIPHFWGYLAGVLALLSIWTLKTIVENYSTYKYYQHLLTIFSILASTFIAVGLSIELTPTFIPLALSMEALVIAWINRRVSINALRPICVLLGIVFGILTLPFVLLTIPQIIRDIPLSYYSHYQSAFPLIASPMLHMGLPALLLIGTAFHLSSQYKDKWAQAFEYAAAGLIAITVYYLTRKLFNSNILFSVTTLFERCTLVNIYCITGILALTLGSRLKQMNASSIGIGFLSLALFRLVVLDLIMWNPLWHHEMIKGVLIFNSLALSYGTPLILIAYSLNKWSTFFNDKWRSLLQFLTYTILFILVSYNIRFYFHGAYLDTGITSFAEIYTYSFIWLLLSLILLFTGILKHDEKIRQASFIIMLLTIGKVFLYDTSELIGLYRFFSFLFLGLSLLGMSFLYTRFISEAKSLTKEG